MMRGVVERGTGQGAKALGRPVAAKTGTTNDYSNAWFIGFTPRLATGVWIGYDRPRSLGKDETGGRTAVPIWTAYMTRVLGDSPREDFPVPERVSLVPMDLDPSNECVRVVTMAFVRGTEPSVSCGPRRQAVTPVASPSVGPPPAPPPLAPAPAPVPAPSPAPAVTAPPATSSTPPSGTWTNMLPRVLLPSPATSLAPPAAAPAPGRPPASRRPDQPQSP
jgi:penicillin-binding protein 1A